MAPSVGMNDVWNAVWRWHLGVPSIPSPVAVDTAPLWAIFNARSGNEYNELNTAHLLALAESPRMLAAAVASERAWDDAWFLNKVSDFSSPRPCVGMYAAYALGVSPPGPLRDESLVSLLRTGDLLPTATAFALLATGWTPICNPDVLLAVLGRLSSPQSHVIVSRAAAECLRNVHADLETASACSLCWTVANHSDAQTRYTAAISLSSLSGALSRDRILSKHILSKALQEDPNRYVRA